MARAVEAGQAFIRLYVDTKQADKNFREFSNKLRMTANTMRGIGSRMTAVGAALSAPYVLGLRSLTTYGDRLDKLSQRHDITIEELSRFSAAAAHAGATLNEVEQVFESINDKSAMLAEGTGEVADAFRALGMDADRFLTTDMIGRMEMIADALGTIREESLRAGFAEQLGGGSAQALLPLLNQGGAAIRAIAEAEGGISSETVRRGVELTDALTDQTGAWRRLSMTLGASVAPEVTKLSQLFTGLLNQMADLAETNIIVAKTFGLFSFAVTGVGSTLWTAGLGISQFLEGALALKLLMPTLTKYFGSAAATFRVFATAARGGALALAGAIAGTVGFAATGAGLRGFAAISDVVNPELALLARGLANTPAGGPRGWGLRYDDSDIRANPVSAEQLERNRSLRGMRGVGDYVTGQLSGRFVSAATIGAMGARGDPQVDLLTRLVDLNRQSLQELRNSNKLRN